MRILVFCVLAALLPTSLVFAEGKIDPQLQPNIIYKKHTHIDFNDAVVEGKVDNPEGVYIVTPPEKKFGNLLRLRPDFHRELVRDSLLLK